MRNMLSRVIAAVMDDEKSGTKESKILETVSAPRPSKQPGDTYCSRHSTNALELTNANTCSEQQADDTSTSHGITMMGKSDKSFVDSHEEKAFNALDSNIYDRDLMYPVAKSVLSWIQLAQGPAAIILAGAEQVPFSVPMNLLLNYSKVAERTLLGGFAESGKNIITLPDDEPETVGLFLIWIQQGELRAAEYSGCTLHVSGEIIHKEPFDNFVQACLHLCNLYILVDKLISRYWDRMKTEILSELEATVLASDVRYQGRSIVIPSTVLRVYRNTVENSELRLFVRDKLCYTFTTMGNSFPALELYVSCIEEFPKDFGIEILKKLITGFHSSEYF